MTFSTDWRTLCAELVSSWDNATGDPDFCDVADTIERARAELAQPEPQGATKGELSQLYRKHGGFNYDGMDEIEFENAVNEAIARWGRPTVKPVSVAERLPRPEDFHPENDWCWGWYDWRWRMMDSTCFYPGCNASHYVPYWAFPVPIPEIEQ